MKPPPPDPTAERIAAGLIGGFFALFGWFTLWQGGVTLAGKRGGSSFVDGRAGEAIAAVSFVFAALGVAMFLRSVRARRAAYRWAALALFVPPAAVVLWRF